MKNILQLFKKMKPKSYYGAGVAEETTDCRNIYSRPKVNMPVEGIGLIKGRNIR